MKYLAGQNILVLGLGASGLALARWCVRYGATVSVADTRAAPPGLPALQSELPTATFLHSEMNQALFDSAPFGLVLKSPGLSPAEVEGVMRAAEARGIARGNELSLFADALAELRSEYGYAPKVIGITGTNGKTTVTSLVGQLVVRAGKRVAMAGNIGPTMLDTLAAKLDREVLPDKSGVPDVESSVLNDETAEPQEGTTETPEIPIIALDRADHGSTLPDDADQPGEESDAVADEVPDADAGLLPLMHLAPVVPQVPVFSALPDVWVLELSSFQLDGVNNFDPTVATVLNITQDHLDWHESLSAYAAVKNRIYGHGLMLLNRDDALVMAAVPPLPPLVRGKQPPGRSYMTFGGDIPQRPGDYGIETVNGMTWLVRAAEADETIKRRRDEEVVLFIQRLMPMDALRIRGRHNAANALAALALAFAAGCALAPMLHGLREYRGEPHRVESVAVINDVEYFDDSKGTNVGATVAALSGLGADRKLVVILGGEGKGQDFSPLLAPVSRYAKAVVLIGRDAPLIRAALESSNVELIDAGSMQEAVEISSRHAQTGDAVLMSPACASFDMFDNYEHRAKVFCDAVQDIGREAGVDV